MPALPKKWSHLTRWQRWGLLACLFLVLYAVIGFFAVPPLGRMAVTKWGPKVLHRPVSVGEIRCNPFLFTVDIANFRVLEPQGNEEFLGFKALHVDFEMSSLLRLALVLQDASLTDPQLHLRLNKNGTMNFSDLAPQGEQADKNASTTVIFPLIIAPFSLTNGTVTLEDSIRNVTHTVKNLDFQLPHFSTRKKDWELFVTPQLSFILNEAPFSLKGRTRPLHNSLKTEFKFQLEQLNLVKYWGYLPDFPDISMTNGSLALHSSLAFEQFEDKLPRLSFQGMVTGRDILLRSKNTTILRVPEIQVDMEDVSLLRQRVALNQVTITKPFVLARRNAQGTMDWAQYFLPKATATAQHPAQQEKNTSAQQKPPTSPFTLTIKDLVLTDGTVRFEDASVSPAFGKTLTIPGIQVHQFSTAANATAEIALKLHTPQGEHLAGNASLGLNPFTLQADLAAHSLKLPSYAPYYQEALPLKAVNATGTARAHFSVDNAKGFILSDASASITQLRLGTEDDKSRIQAKKISLDTIGLNLRKRTLRTGVLLGQNWDIYTSVDKTGRSTLLAAFDSLQKADSHAQTSSKKDQPTKSPGWSVDIAGATLNHAGLHVEGKNSPVILTKLQVGALHLKTAQESLYLGASTGSVQALVQRNAQGQINLAALFAPNPTKKTQPENSEWKTQIARLTLKDSQITFTDTSFTPALQVRLDNIRLDAKDISNTDEKPITLNLACLVERTGTLTAKTSVQPKPLQISGSLNAQKLPLDIADPLLAAGSSLRVASGHLDGEMHWKFTADGGGNITGSLNAKSLNLLEKNLKQKVFTLDSLTANKANIQLKPLQIHIPNVEMQNPQGFFQIDAQGKTTVEHLVRKTPSTQKPKKKTHAATSPPLDFTIESFQIRDGKFTFTDKSLSQPFVAHITAMAINATTLSLDPEKRVTLDISARINDSAPLRASGWLHPLKTPFEGDTTVHLRDLDIVTFSPYAAKFIAYPVTQGQLDWDSQIQTQGSKLIMGNTITARQFTLGDKVNAPQATKAPVKLGLSILRDMSGDIAITLPVKGDLNDPKFSIGGVVVQAFLGLIVKAVASPFSLLGSLIPGGGPQNMSSLPFPPGQALAGPETINATAAMAVIMEKRPSLRIALTGHVLPDIDKPALEEALFLRKLQLIKYAGLSHAKREKTSPEALNITEDEYEKFLWEAYKEEPGEKAEGAFGITKKVPRAEQEAFLKKNIQVTDNDLLLLAVHRADAVKNRLVNELNIPANRVFTKRPGKNDLHSKPGVSVEARR